ncbi:trehalose 6-phosphate synthase [Faunimonas pinastri]|uniref:Trehalose 6-phosphate synthase n=1 Tax=Faunimonas pinastri TaxID=1855383 RepID=A0A1H9NT16_9HYPH|nr:trehalose-6-phosphate synthase [Faunimonas pinastri]SER38805.1 trehalose 6-phosphate synthase [Faunimonas pinastri]
MTRIVIVSNRVGPLSDEGKAGGLAVGLADALRKRGGIWFGWSGEQTPEGIDGPAHVEDGPVKLVTVDFSEEDADEFYSGFANQTLWPILHYRVNLANFERRFETGYDRVNKRMAAKLMPMLESGDTVWIHDYHYLTLGQAIRQGGFEGPIGFFLHTPFPAPEIFAALPNARRLGRSMLEYNVIGFQTERDRRNFRRFVLDELGGTTEDGELLDVDGNHVRTGVFPIGIDAERFAEFAVSSEAQRRERQVRNLIRECQQIIGVDRLDYTKGIPERFHGFERFLEQHPESRGRIFLLQVAPVSRGNVDAYSDLRSEMESLAGRINGEHGGLDWAPIRILTRGFARKSLAGIYRSSRMALVTPLRDGMNLVAKEYVAAQNPDDPGVLILSRFAGAAAELTEALIVNPHDDEDVSGAIQKAFHMPLGERQERWNALNAKVRKTTAESWAANFLDVLDQIHRDENTARRAARAGG